MLVRHEIILYACKVEETTNGSWSCARGEARQAFQVIAKGRIAPNGEFDERKRAAKNGEDQAQETAEEKATLVRAEAWSS